MTDKNDNREYIILTDPTKGFVHPFENKQLVFTGALSTMTRSEAAKRVRACGGILQGAVTKETDFLILGKNRRSKSSKQMKAEQLISLGADLQIIIEDDFLWLLTIPRA